MFAPIDRHDMSAVYRLGYDVRNFEFYIQISPAMFKKLWTTSLTPPPLVRGLMAEFPFRTFYPGIGLDFFGQKVFGFNEACTISSEGEMIRISIPLPKVQKNTDNPQLYLKACQASLALLSIFLSLEVSNGQIPANLFLPKGNNAAVQLISVEGLKLDGDFGGAAIAIALSPSMLSGLRTLGKHQFAAAESVMYQVDKHMWETERGQHAIENYTKEEWEKSCRREFRIDFLDNRWLHLTVPGNACGLDPEHNAGNELRGYTLVPHNVDCAVQQLALLAGVASLADMVWEQK